MPTGSRVVAKGKTGLGIFADGMVEHDSHVGMLLDKLDVFGMTDNTIVIYSTDNSESTTPTSASPG
jgi:arylsulfatase A-like enzyme